jgi:hypothetical protein
MTVEEFLERVKFGGLIDYDGFGNWSNGTHLLSDKCVYPSECRNLKKIPHNATHVVWFNL